MSICVAAESVSQRREGEDFIKAAAEGNAKRMADIVSII